MGAGKTSVGQAVAKRLGWSFEDLDDRIQAREGRTIGEIFEQSGEAQFRLCETVALRELLSETEPSCRIIALGGGAFAQAENRALMKQTSGISVFLEAPIQELYRRCQEQELKRPLHQDQSLFRKLYEARHPLYMEATLRVETSGKDVVTIADEIGRILGLIEEI